MQHFDRTMTEFDFRYPPTPTKSQSRTKTHIKMKEKSSKHHQTYLTSTQPPIQKSIIPVKSSFHTPYAIISLDMEPSNILIAFGLTLFAGLSTGIGSALAFFTKRTNKKALSIALGFSAGVMIYVSFVEILAEAFLKLQEASGHVLGSWYAVGAFFRSAYNRSY